MRKLMSVLLATILVCTSGILSIVSAVAEDDVVVLQYWYPWGGDSETWDLWRIAEFEAANPGIKIEATYVPPDGGLSNGKLMAAIAGGQVPDVVVTDQCQTAFTLQQTGALRDMTDYLAAEGLTIDSYNTSFHSLLSQGMYLLPMDGNVIMLYYNKDLFAAAGLDPENPPKTIEELDAAAQALDKYDENGELVQMGFIPWLDTPDINPMLWPWVFGGEITNMAENTVNITDEGMVKSLEWQRSYAERYNPEKVKAFTSGFGALFTPDHPFMTGKVAMTVIGNWMHEAIRQYAPDLNYGVCAIPYPENGGRAMASDMSVNVYMVPEGSAHPEAAAKFITWCYKDYIVADNIETWYTVPALSVLFDTVQYVKDGNENYLLIKEIAESENTQTLGMCTVAGELRDDLKTLRDNVIYNMVDPLPLLEELQEKLTLEIQMQ